MENVPRPKAIDEHMAKTKREAAPSYTMAKQ